MRAARRLELEAADELDLMMLYLHQGLWFEDYRPRKDESLHIVNWTDELDRHFLYKQLRTRPNKPQLDPVEKPTVTLPEAVDRLVSALERKELGPSLSCAIAILDLHSDALRKVEEAFREMRHRVVADGRRHTLTVPISAAGHDLVFVEGPGPLTEQEAAFYARVRFSKGSVKVYVVWWMGDPSTDKLSTWVFER